MNMPELESAGVARRLEFQSLPLFTALATFVLPTH